MVVCRSTRSAQKLIYGDRGVICDSYLAKHPRLLVTTAPHKYADGFSILDVFAYYLPPGNEGEDSPLMPDRGTVLRFVEQGVFPLLYSSYFVSYSRRYSQPPADLTVFPFSSFSFLFLLIYLHAYPTFSSPAF